MERRGYLYKDSTKVSKGEKTCEIFGKTSGR